MGRIESLDSGGLSKTVVAILFLNPYTGIPVKGKEKIASAAKTLPRSCQDFDSINKYDELKPYIGKLPTSYNLHALSLTLQAVLLPPLCALL